MNEHALEQIVMDLAEPVVHALGLQIWGVEISQAGRTILRLFVDVPPVASDADSSVDGVCDNDMQDVLAAGQISANIDQCEDISRHLGLALEVEDVMPGAYILEVSTPGLSRRFFRLTQMAPYLGDMIEARLHMTYEGRRIWRGKLQSLEDSGFILAPASLTPQGDIVPDDIPPIRLPWDAARRVSRIHIFRQPVKPGKGSGKGKGSGTGRKSPLRDVTENTSREDRGEA